MEIRNYLEVPMTKPPENPMKEKPASPPKITPDIWAAVGGTSGKIYDVQGGPMPMMLPPCSNQDLPQWMKMIPEYEHQVALEEAERQARGECEAEIADLANKLHDANRALVKEEELNREFGESLDFTTECIRDRDAQLAALTEERDRLKLALENISYLDTRESEVESAIDLAAEALTPATEPKGDA